MYRICIIPIKNQGRIVLLPNLHAINQSPLISLKCISK